MCDDFAANRRSARHRPLLGGAGHPSGRRRFWAVEPPQEHSARDAAGPRIGDPGVERSSSRLLESWRRQMQEERMGPDDAAGALSAGETRGAPELAPPILAGMPASCCPQRQGFIEIALSSGVFVRVDSNVDGAALRRVLDALQAR